MNNAATLYMYAQVNQYRTFTAPGGQSGNLVRQCYRVLLPQDKARYPEIADKDIFFFNWNRSTKTAQDGCFLTHDEFRSAGFVR